MRNLFLLFISLSMPFSYAGSGEFNSIWLMTRDHILDGVLDPTKTKDEVKLEIRLNSHHNKFSGEYTKLKNDSLFTGETYSVRGSTLIVFFQYGQEFYVIHNGRKVGHNHYVGTWFGPDNLSGDFELRKK
jgi:hypothetical protein